MTRTVRPCPPSRPSLTTVAEPPCDSAIAADDRETEARAAGVARARAVAAVEALERMRELLVGETGTGVGDLDHGGVAAVQHPDRRRRAGRGVRAHVREQVVEDLTQPLAVALHLDRLPARRARSRGPDRASARPRRRRGRPPRARPACARAAVPGRAGRAAGGRRRGAPSVATRAGCRSSTARDRPVARGRHGRRARRRRAPRRAACAARATRRR